MQPIEFLNPAELAQHQREIRIENRAYARAQERAAADPCREYQCSCGATCTALDVAWFGRDCACGQQMMGVRAVQLSNPVTGDVTVALQAGPA